MQTLTLVDLPMVELPEIKRLSVIGLQVAATNYADAVQWILHHALAGEKVLAVEAANTHVAALARSDAEFGAVMKRFDLICPDGAPLVWALNAQLPAAEKLRDRVYGPTLMLRTIEASADDGSAYRHFLLGGKSETLEKLEVRFKNLYPKACISATYSPPFGEWPDGEFERICEKIRTSGANLIWVGLGCPRQERWIAEHKDRLPAGVYFGIGAAFAFHAGEVRQAPAFLQRIGCEWAYRMAMEPRRLFKRYFTYNSLFIYHLIQDHRRARD